MKLGFLRRLTTFVRYVIVYSPYASMYVFVCVFKSSLKQLGQLKPKFMWNHNGIREKNIQIIPVICLHIVICWGRGLFAGLLPQMWPRSAGLLAGHWKLKS